MQCHCSAGNLIACALGNDGSRENFNDLGSLQSPPGQLRVGRDLGWRRTDLIALRNYSVAVPDAAGKRDLAKLRVGTAMLEVPRGKGSSLHLILLRFLQWLDGLLQHSREVCSKMAAGFRTVPRQSCDTVMRLLCRPL